MNASFDFETYDWTKPLCCGFNINDTEFFIYDKDNPNKVGESTIKFMYSMYATHHNKWWAHNMGRFDGLFLSAAASRLGWEQKAAIAGQGSKVVVLMLKPANAKRWMKIYDTYALAPSSLRDLAKDFALPSRKLFTKEDYKVSMRDKPRAEVERGCLMDCKLVIELLEKIDTYVTEWGGKVRATFSSTSLGIIKAQLAEEGLALPKIDVGVNEWIQPSYTGGRVEVFNHTPNFEMCEYDVCSSYPWSMTQALPWEPVDDASIKTLEDIPNGYQAIIEADVQQLPNIALPILPYRPSTEGIYFPVGAWRGRFALPELRFARRHGASIIPRRAMLFTSARPFERTISQIYGLKQTATGAKRTFAKYTLNGAYGKFGEKPEKTELQCFATETDAVAYALHNTQDTYPDGRTGNFENGILSVAALGTNTQALAVTKLSWPKHAHYAIASYITAYSRMKLAQAIIDNPSTAYCDTDCIFIPKRQAPAGLAIGKGLGEWKEEIASCRGIFYAPKIYKLKLDSGKWKCAAKGFSVGEDELDIITSGRSVTHERMRLLKTQLRESPASVARVKTAKHWAGKSGKRNPSHSGKSIPWTVAQLDKGEHLNAVSPAARFIR